MRQFEEGIVMSHRWWDIFDSMWCHKKKKGKHDTKGTPTEGNPKPNMENSKGFRGERTMQIMTKYAFKITRIELIVRIVGFLAVF